MKVSKEEIIENEEWTTKELSYCIDEMNYLKARLKYLNALYSCLIVFQRLVRKQELIWNSGKKS